MALPMDRTQNDLFTFYGIAGEGIEHIHFDAASTAVEQIEAFHFDLATTMSLRCT